MTLIRYYHEQCRHQGYQPDARQLTVLKAIQPFYDDLLNEERRRKRWFNRLRQKKRVKGCYLFGNVGVGKTFIMDCFYRRIPLSQKMRTHFHEFIHAIHQKLRHYAGKPDPLAFIAEEIAASTQLICFDELHITDTADAMILGRLLENLFQRGVSLFVTSNEAPDHLYQRGLQRELFKKTIALIKDNMTVIEIDSQFDYRSQKINQYSRKNEAAMALKKLDDVFQQLSNNANVTTDPIRVHDRKIEIIKRANNVIWFDFDIICAPPRNPSDYLHLTKEYKTILISNMRTFSDSAKDRVVLFIRLIDVLYNANVKLIYTGDATMEKTYLHEHINFQYARAISRLNEMSIRIA